jgi:integrase
MWEGQAGAPSVAEFSAHSLRRGGATAAANAGFSLADIMEHGRWKSDAVKDYIRKSAVERRKLSAGM